MADNYGRPSTSSSSKKRKTDRRTVERERRIEMNRLCARLTSLLPPQTHFNPSRMRISQADQIEQATHYIIESRERLEGLKRQKEQLERINNEAAPPSTVEVISRDEEMMRKKDNDHNATRLPIIQIIDLGGAIEVQLVTLLERGLKLGQVIRVLEEEGAEVGNCSFSIQGDKVFHTLHAEARIPRVGMGKSSIQQRLQELVR